MPTYLKGISLRELRDLYVLNYQDMEHKIAATIQNMRESEDRISSLLGRDITGCDVLEIGPGQRSPYRYYLASRNRYLGIDIEPLQERGILSGFVDDLRNRGATRAVKTLGRRALRLDEKFDREMRRQLKIGHLEGSILCMDAAQMGFDASSMDVVVSVSVFEHIPAPEQVMAEIARVLRPGGVAHIITHFYTSDSGIHDTRIFVGQRDGIPYWSHLRPEHRDKVRANSYLNELRLDDYRRAFDAHWPGARHVLLGGGSEARRDELRHLRRAGELSDYSDEELLMDALCTTWRKPQNVEAVT